MTNREQYERMIYLEHEEVCLILDALVEAWYELPEPDDDAAARLYYKMAQHYKIKGLRFIGFDKTIGEEHRGGEDYGF